MKMFPEARVIQRAMAALDHCLLKLSLRQCVQRKGIRKCFMFETM